MDLSASAKKQLPKDEGSNTNQLDNQQNRDTPPKTTVNVERKRTPPDSTISDASISGTSKPSSSVKSASAEKKQLQGKGSNKNQLDNQLNRVTPPKTTVNMEHKRTPSDSTIAGANSSGTSNPSSSAISSDTSKNDSPAQRSQTELNTSGSDTCSGPEASPKKKSKRKQSMPTKLDFSNEYIEKSD